MLIPILKPYNWIATQILVQVYQSTTTSTLNCSDPCPFLPSPSPTQIHIGMIRFLSKNKQKGKRQDTPTPLSGNIAPKVYM